MASAIGSVRRLRAPRPRQGSSGSYVSSAASCSPPSRPFTTHTIPKYGEQQAQRSPTADRCFDDEPVHRAVRVDDGAEPVAPEPSRRCRHLEQSAGDRVDAADQVGKQAAAQQQAKPGHDPAQTVPCVDSSSPLLIRFVCRQSRAPAGRVSSPSRRRTRPGTAGGSSAARRYMISSVKSCCCSAIRPLAGGEGRRLERHGQRPPAPGPGAGA